MSSFHLPPARAAFVITHLIEASRNVALTECEYFGIEMSLIEAELAIDNTIRECWLILTSTAIPAELDPLDFVQTGVES